MKTVLRYGAYVWTASSAGWFVIAYATALAAPLAGGIGCAAMAGLFLLCADAW